ncbi:MAG: hypothetical protein OWU32_12165 [Firmicutes bacterium]|nr:hypothetical protein [Bacillota bacterium]
METSTADCIRKIQDTSEALLDAIVHNETGKIEALVVEQIQYAKALNARTFSDAERDQVSHLIQLAKTQQILIEQALHVSEFYLQHLNAGRAFNTTG